jgi:hypothetical protein
MGTTGCSGFTCIGFICLLLCLNVEAAFKEDKCPDGDAPVPGIEAGSERSLALLSRTKRGFGGKEQVNMTLVNINVLGAPGWLPLFCSAVPDVFFHVTGYTVLGNFLQTSGLYYKKISTIVSDNCN